MRYNMCEEANAMEKTTTMNLRVNPVVKQEAEDVLKQLGVPMATAVDMFLRQIALTGSIPFAIAASKSAGQCKRRQNDRPAVLRCHSGRAEGCRGRERSGCQCRVCAV